MTISKEQARGTAEFRLRAMVANYDGVDHQWDHLDAEVCAMAADQIEQQAARIAELEGLLLEHVSNFDGDSDWDESAWHERAIAAVEGRLPELEQSSGAQGEPSARCEDCPPDDYPTDATRCAPCDRRSAPAQQGEPVAAKAWNLLSRTATALDNVAEFPDSQESMQSALAAAEDMVSEVSAFLHAHPAPAQQPAPKGKNGHGLDAAYFHEKLSQIVRDIDYFTPTEMARALARYVVVADETVLREAEFQQPAVPEGWQIERTDDGRIVVQKRGGGMGVVVEGDDGSSIAASVLYYFADSLLSAQQPTFEFLPQGAEWRKFNHGYGLSYRCGHWVIAPTESDHDRRWKLIYCDGPHPTVFKHDDLATVKAWACGFRPDSADGEGLA